MAQILPFQAVRYAGENVDISAKLAPPYDVLTESDKQRLLARDPQNFVAVDLPHTPPKHAGPPAAYQGAAAQLGGWLKDGVMVHDAAPAIYVYHQTYTHDDRRYVRKMFAARLRVEPFGAGSVFPHEQTFGGPKEDRLLLTQATRANLSPIFGLYEDEHNEIAARLEASLPKQPTLHGTLDGVENRIWAVTDATTLTAVRELIAPRPIYIADGHHRYGTALLYREALQREHGALPIEHPANYVLCVFCAMEDPGLLILPTHRVLTGTKVDPRLLSQDPNLEFQPLPERDPEYVLNRIAEFGALAVVFVDPNGEMAYVRPREASLMEAIAPDHSPAWRNLGVAFLQSYLLEQRIIPAHGGTPPAIEYIKNTNAAYDAARHAGGSAFLLQPNTMAELRDVCSAGDLMPQKSTFFFPKIASGLVINPLHD